jgi:hypothetical protein
MEPFQASPIPESLKTFIPRLAHDFCAAISYASFYPADNFFVIQSAQKLFEDFQKFLQCGQSLIIHVENEKLYINDYYLSPFDDLSRLFQVQNLLGVEITKDISVQELTDWLQIIAFSSEENIKNFKRNWMTHILPLSKLNAGAVMDIPKEPLAFMLNTFEMLDTLTMRSHFNRIDGLHQNHQALLDFAEESWRFFHTQQKIMERSPEMNRLIENFDQLFERLMDRMEKPLPDLKSKIQSV